MPFRWIGHKTRFSRLHWCLLDAGAVLIALMLLGTLLLIMSGTTEASGTIHYVAQDCGTVTPCYPTIQEAVNAATTGDEVHVASGTYTNVHTQGGNAQIVYLNKSLTLRGGYTTTDWTAPNPNLYPTTLDAQAQGYVLYITGDITVTVRGLHITGGKANLGGGLCANSAHLILLENHIYNNTSLESPGGGGYVSRGKLLALINTFQNNHADTSGGGLFLSYIESGNLSDNTFISNTAGTDGGGLFIVESGLTLERNLLLNNTAANAGGIFLRSNIAVHLINNVIANNTATQYGGGLLAHNSIAHLQHNTIARNYLGEGSGVYVGNPWNNTGSDNTLWLTNTILVSHTTGINANDNSNVTVNSILWDANTTITVSQGTGSQVTLQNQYSGDPAFADDGYHLTAGSAALDRGIPTNVTNDIDGNHRPLGLAPELGVDEARLSAPPSLSVSKSATPDPVRLGDTLTYTLRVTNTGSALLHATVTDSLPLHIQHSTTPKGSAILPGGTLVWTPTLPTGEVWMTTVVVTVEAEYTGWLTNVVHVTTPEGATGQDTAITQVTGDAPDLMVTGLRFDPVKPAPGGSVKIYMTIRNISASPANTRWDGAEDWIFVSEAYLKATNTAPADVFDHEGSVCNAWSAPLGAGESREIMCEGTVPAPGGTWYAFAQADVTWDIDDPPWWGQTFGLVQELDETNNRFGTTLEVEALVYLPLIIRKG